MRQHDPLHDAAVGGAWVCSYPEELPVFTVSALENIVYSAQAKRELEKCLEQEAAAMQGEQMVYNLVEWLKEHLMHYVELSKQKTGDHASTHPATNDPIAPAPCVGGSESAWESASAGVLLQIRTEEGEDDQGAETEVLFEVPSAAKTPFRLPARSGCSRFGAVDEKPRGWNWVDIVAHLSSRPQTQ